MKVQKKVSVAGEWAKIGVDIKDGCLITILDGGTETESEFGKQIVFKIKGLAGEKNQSFNQTTMNNLIDAFGDDTDNWINKQAKCITMKAMVSGSLKNVTYFHGPGQAMDDKGKFYRTGAATASTPVVQTEEVTDDINPDDIPF